MAVDRGGLQYKIEVQNRFSGTLRDFKSQVASARKEFTRFKDNLRGANARASGVANNLDKIARASKRLADQEARANAASQTRRNTLNAERRAAERLAQSASQLNVAQTQQLRGFRAERVAVLRLESAYRRLAASRRAAGVRNNAPLNTGAAAATAAAAPVVAGGGGGGGRTPQQGARQLAATAAAATAAESAGSRMLFTFRRLFGVLAAFTIAREVASAIGEMVKSMVSFNQVLERANLGIASLILASGGVRDALGGAVSQSEGLALAQREAARQTRLLRRDGLKTAATFEQLVDTFQVAVGPGLAAGLDLDQIRRFTVQVSQAASAAGVAQNQLSEEIRSILSGTIQQRTTRLAAVLGITNEDIRRAKEAGVLIEFLNSKFAAFTQAGEVALTTFDALVSNTADAFSQLLGAGGLEFFDQLKASLGDIFNQLVRADNITGVLEPSPRAVAIVKALASGLTQAVAEATRLTKALGFDQLEDGAQLIGSTVGSLSRLIGRIVEGFVRGANDLASILRSVAAQIQKLTGISLFEGDTIQTVVRVVTLVGGLVLSLKVVLGLTAAVGAAWAAVSGGIAAAISALRIFQVSLIATSSAFGLTLGAALGLVVALGFAANEARRLNKVSGNIELTWVSIAKLIKVELIDGLAQTGAFAAQLFNLIAAQAKVAALEAGKALALALPESLTGSAVSDLENAIIATKGLAKAENDRLEKLRAGLETLRGKDVKEILDENSGTSLEALAKRAADAVNSGLDRLNNALGSRLGQAAKEQAANFRDLNSVIDSLAPTLVRNRKSLEEQAALAKKIKDETIKAKNALLEQQDVLGLSSTAARSRLLSVQAEARVRERTAKLDREEQTAQNNLSQLAAKRQVNQTQINKLTGESKLLFEEALTVSKQILEQESQRGVLQDRLKIKQLELTKLTSRGVGGEQFKAASKEALELEQSIDQLEDNLVRLRDSASDIFADSKPEEAEVLGRLIRDQIGLLGQRKSLEGEILQIRKEREAIEDREADNLQRQLTLQARRQAASITPQLGQLSAGVAQARARLASEQALASGQGTGAQAAAVAAEAQLRVDQQRVVFAQEQAKLGQEALDQTLLEIQTRKALLEIQLEGATDKKEQLRLQGSIALAEESAKAVTEELSLTRQKDTAELAKQNLALQISETRLQRLKNLAGEGGFFKGMAQLAQDELTKLPTAFETTFGLIQGAAQQMTDFVSDLIVDAFDPTKKVDIKERFGRLMQGIAKLIIKELIKIAIQAAVTKAIAGGLFGSSGGEVPTTGGGGSFSFAEGTSKVPTRRGRHITRPRGLPASDTVPAWLTPGEAVIRRSSAFLYGHDVMAAINAGLVDPTALRALAGTSRRARRMTLKRGPGFAEGGVVGSAVDRTAEAVNPPSPGPAVAVVVPDQRSAARLFAQGDEAMLRFVQRNRQRFRSALGV